MLCLGCTGALVEELMMLLGLSAHKNAPTSVDLTTLHGLREATLQQTAVISNVQMVSTSLAGSV